VTGPATQWGRIDDEGTVYVRTAEGERAVGSWHAGDPAAGLAHFARRYDDLATEIGLLARRVASGSGDPKAALTSVGRLREQVAQANVVGDLAALDSRLDEIEAGARERAEQAVAERAQARVDAVAAKTRLAEEAETLAASTAWKASGDRLREIGEQWRSVRVDRRSEEELWKRFVQAREEFGRRRGAHFAALDTERETVRTRKEVLVREAESLADSTEWASTARRLQELMRQWKEPGRAGKEAEEALWARFKAAQDRFFTRRTEVFGERDAEQRRNAAAKEVLIAEAESLDLADPTAAQARLREVQDRYDAAGKVPREAMAGLDARMRAAEQRVRDAADAQWQSEAARNNPLVQRMREAVDKLERQLERARAAGREQDVARAEAALAARREWLAQAERSVSR